MLLTTKNGKRDKIHIYLDGEYTATTTAAYWATCAFRNGDPITQSEWEELSHKLHFGKMYHRALDLLAMRDHSRRELSEKLTSKFSDSAADRPYIREQAEMVCDRLEELGLLSDERFAKAYAEELARRKHLSPRGLRAALLAKGLAGELVNSVLEGAEINVDASISELLKTKFRSRDLSDKRDRERTFSALLRLGYSYSDIRAAMSSMGVSEENYD